MYPHRRIVLSSWTFASVIAAETYALAYVGARWCSTPSPTEPVDINNGAIRGAGTIMFEGMPLILGVSFVLALAFTYATCARRFVTKSQVAALVAAGSISAGTIAGYVGLGLRATPLLAYFKAVVLFTGVALPILVIPALAWWISMPRALTTRSTPVSLAINWQIAPELSGLLASGELVRGFVQHWRRGSDNRWSALASAAGGGAAGLVLSAVVALRWGESSWAEVLESVGFGVAIFLVIGWLVQYQVREAKENQ